ncbi:MAG: heparinase II/III family protein, partial [Victivallales bacterium]|nr:heparinase II/III family protein [Victivallales bacterium]
MLHTFRLFPSIDERAPWEAVAASQEKRYITSQIVPKAESLLSEPIPELTAGEYMEFALNGNRSHYEAKYFPRRANLPVLVLAECLEHKGRFVPKIIDYIWAMLSEPTWCLPAHAPGFTEKERNARDPLPTIDYPLVDLFAAETGAFLSQTLEIMEPELAAISPNLVRRIRAEVNDRLLVPTEKNLWFHHWSRCTNNWNPWICSNLLLAASTIFEGDNPRFDAYANQLMQSVQNYYDAYSEDGGCDEGPGYWNLSPTRYFLFMECIHRASDGNISCFDDAKFRNMCRYITDAWYEKERFARFADCGGRHTIYTGLLRAMCERSYCDAGLAMADAMDNYDFPFPKMHSAFAPYYFDLFTPCHPELKPAEKSFMAYPILQQLFVKRNGSFIAIKGGCNIESHNHNDVGQFIIANKGFFTVLDLGSATYNKSTFSEDRYSNYPQSGLSHNPLVFDGVPQEEGPAKAVGFNVTGDADAFTCTMEISGSYPKSIGLLSYVRSFSFDGKALTVRDEWKASRPLSPSMTLLHEVPNHVFTSSEPFTTEEFPLDDAWLKNAWGDV